MLKNRKYGFTLVELLASIVVLAIILVIAVPKVMNIINDAKKGVFANSVKLIASGAEQIHAENEAMGIDDKITCESVAQINSEDYKLCEISFEKDEARVTVIGDGKYNGLSVVYASKTNAVVQDGEPERLYTFDDVYSLIDSMSQKILTLESEVQTLKEQNEENSSVDIETIENLENQLTNLTNRVDSVEVNMTMLKVYPVGSIYITTESDNPGTKFGGTWVAYGAGRTLVGVDSSQTEFASVGLTGGAKTHTLIEGELPSIYGEWAVPVIGTHAQKGKKGNAYGTSFGEISSSNPNGIDIGNLGTTYNSGIQYGYGFKFGNNQPHNNLQPYITVYMWKRTA